MSSWTLGYEQQELPPMVQLGPSLLREYSDKVLRDHFLKFEWFLVTQVTPIPDQLRPLLTKKSIHLRCKSSISTF